MLLALSFKTTLLGVLQIIVLGGIGFVLVKKGFLAENGLSILSKLVIEITLPLLIFAQLIEGFNFSRYPNWWWFPLISIAITLLGFLVGKLLLMCYPDIQYRQAFISLVAFQNSGYLPLVLFAAIFPAGQARQLFIYLFLFLLGFNLIIWSFGVWYLTGAPALRIFLRLKKPDAGDVLELSKIFSPPVIATTLSLILIALGVNRFLPHLIVRPLKMIGECTMPLAMLVVGGNLAAIAASKLEGRAIFQAVFAKVALLPLMVFIILLLWRPEPLLGFLIMAQAAMPSATSLSLIARHHRLEDKFINQGILISHLFSILTIPLFLALFLASPAAF
ncbi:MAG: AEC family transporter [Candidatus Omnitrophota bacterium]